jgi:hypothetical protein
MAVSKPSNFDLFTKLVGGLASFAGGPELDAIGAAAGVISGSISVFEPSTSDTIDAHMDKVATKLTKNMDIINDNI